MNKRKQRTENLRKAIRDVDTNDYVVNTIEQHNFDRIVAQGIIVEGPASVEHEDPQSGGDG